MCLCMSLCIYYLAVLKYKLINMGTFQKFMLSETQGEAFRTFDSALFQFKVRERAVAACGVDTVLICEIRKYSH